MPWLLFPLACSRLTGGKERLISRGHGFPEFRGNVWYGLDNRALSKKGSWPNTARSPAADMPGPQRISQRGEAPRLGETARAGAAG
ncbi:hypothetical protein [Desulfosporosinus nitroreducens]|uniref:hypothetical protein n=1 Tax=Desulfosporosinus nitroreducens TaxID=2018668 RepID=UPI00207C719C|nr:hypothetical protein [Desulfosporosinus nitroreducens]MCO1604541.1 hypothetical protein [Desulfosporosinus nitroreducens]